MSTTDSSYLFVIPAQAGIQIFWTQCRMLVMQVNAISNTHEESEISPGACPELDDKIPRSASE